MADSVKIRAVTGRPTALCGVKNTVRTLISIDTPPPKDDTERIPLKVAVVLDRSGSMRGEKLAYAKRAVRKLVKHLHTGDSLHFVTYDDRVNTVFTNGDLSDVGKELLYQQIDSVKVGGRTNLAGGLKRGVECLQEEKIRNEEEDGPCVRRVFLFSDGLVNAGVTSKSAILSQVDAYGNEGITVSTFGIGTDFDEPLMTAIAARGKGSYYFLGTMESIPRLVSKSVHSLLRLAGTEATMQIQGINGAIVSKVYDIRDEDQDTDRCNSEVSSSNKILGDVDLGDLHVDNTKQILVEFEIAPTTSMQGEKPPPTQMLNYSLSYLPTQQHDQPMEIDGGEGQVISTSSQQQLKASLNGTVWLGFTTDRSQLQADEDAEVAVAYAIQMHGIRESRALELVDQRQVEEAIKLKEQSIEELSKLLNKLALVQDNRDGCCVMLAKVLERARDLLEDMKSKDMLNPAEVSAFQMATRYEREVCCALSVSGLSYGEDSDSDDY